MASKYASRRAAADQRSDRATSPGSAERIPPHSDDAETAVLGAMMLDKDAVGKVLDILSADAFYQGRHRIIYEAMLQLADRNQPIDIITLNDELRRSEKLSEIGGSHYLSDLNLRTPTAANVEFHARIVFEKALRRRVIAAATSAIETAYNDTIDPFEALDEAERQIYTVTESRRTGKGQEMMKGLTHQALAYLEQIASNRKEGRLLGVPSGLAKLDAMLCGFQRSDLIYLAARPSVGKTSFATTLARNAAVDFKTAVGFFSLEMSGLQLALRLIAAEARVDLQRIRSGDLDHADWQRIVATMHRLVEAKIIIDDTAALTLRDLRSRARVMKREHGIGLIIIDYIQLMRGPKAENRQNEVSEISRGLKALAKDLDLPIIALSQLSRTLESRADKEPMLSDLRDSGSLEQDADVVLFIHRPSRHGQITYTDGMLTEGTAEIIVGKQRQGPTGSVRTAYIESTTSFENLSTAAEMGHLPTAFNQPF